MVLDPYRRVVPAQEQFILESDTTLILKDDVFWRQMAKLKSAWHIFASKFTGGPKAKRGTVEEIIDEIHSVRFDPAEPFLISGDHFSMLYPRSLGIFYHSLLDSRTARSDADWTNRQLIYLKTWAYALQVYAQTGRLSTTIVPIGPRSVALMDIYAPPSDTMYSILYAGAVLTGKPVLQERYQFESKNSRELQTVEAAQKLLDLYHEDLVKHWSQYVEMVQDPETGLVRREISLSGVKDMAHRESSFYDNVILWRTMQLAQELRIIEQNPQALDDLRTRILQAFWDEDAGIFIEDLSEISKERKHYSSDWLVAYQTGFLDVDAEADLAYLLRSVDYIRRNAIDQPFGVQYHPDERPKQLHWLVRMTAAQYGSTAIWSNWGMEYIKLMIDLARVSGDRVWLERADRQLEAYRYNIKRYRGYPEVYNDSGDFFRTFFYKSVRRTGWVVSFEEAQAMYESVSQSL